MPAPHPLPYAAWIVVDQGKPPRRRYFSVECGWVDNDANTVFTDFDEADCVALVVGGHVIPATPHVWQDNPWR